MSSSGFQLVVVALVVLALLAATRRTFAKRGAGKLAQLEFKQAHGAEVARLLDGRVDERPGSPWIDVRFGGRAARLVAAPLYQGRWQAGVELLEWRIPVEIWLTTGSDEELDVPRGLDLEATRSIALALGRLEVDNVCSLGSTGDHHVLRVQFDDLAQLPDRLAQIAPLLEQLERLAPLPPA